MYEDSHLEEAYEDRFYFDENAMADYLETREAELDSERDYDEEAANEELILSEQDEYEPEPREREEPEVDDGPYHYVPPGDYPPF